MKLTQGWAKKASTHKNCYVIVCKINKQWIIVVREHRFDRELSATNWYHFIGYVWSQDDGADIEQWTVGYGWRQIQEAKLKIVGGVIPQSNHYIQWGEQLKPIAKHNPFNYTNKKSI